MKYVLNLVLVLLYWNVCSAQLNNNTKVLGINLSNFSFEAAHGVYQSDGWSPPSSRSEIDNNPILFQLQAECTFGKVKNNHLLSYGVGIDWRLIHQSAGPDEIIFAVTPEVTYHKLYKLANRLYAAPYAKVGFSYGYSIWLDSTQSQKSYSNNFFAEIHPFTLIYCLTKHTNVVFSLAVLQASYGSNLISDKFDTVDRKIKYSFFTFNGYLSNYSIGIQKVF